MADFVFLVIVTVVSSAIWFWFRLFWVAKKRREADMQHQRDSLRFDAAEGLYRWQTIHGTELSSKDNPDAPGGAWDTAVREAVSRIHS